MFCLFCVLPANAQKSHKLVGVWQQVQATEGGEHEINLPVWKVVQSDGRFCTFLIANKEGKSIQTTNGTYKITSETTYEEHIVGSITDPDLIGKSNKITYEFDGKDRITIRYTLPGRQREGVEQWVRVKLEIPG